MATIAYKFLDQIRVWCADGVSLSEMGRRCGTNKRYVKQVIREFQIPYTARKPGSCPGHHNPSWKGGRKVEKPDGYILLHMPEHPNCDRHGYVREHRHVVEQHIGRLLERGEVVHHKNGIRDDNRIENLEVFASNAAHLAHELKGRCPNWSEEGKAKLRSMPRYSGPRRPNGQLLPKPSPQETGDSPSL